MRKGGNPFFLEWKNYMHVSAPIAPPPKKKMFRAIKKEKKERKKQQQ